jgi:TRAP-type C4-dicarboxylate transport system substrate-binding protein
MVRLERTIVLALAGLLLALSAGCTGSGSNKAGGNRARKPVVLTLANPIGDTEELDGFTKEVSRLSGGTIRVDVRSRWRFGQVNFENGLIGDVRADKADFGVVGSRSWESVGVTSLRALGAPFLIDSYALQERVVGSYIATEMLQDLRPIGLVGIGVLPGPLRRPLGIAHPLLKPSDYAGLRVGVQQSRVASATMRALGAKPVWVAARVTIAGLDGVEQHISAIQGEQYVKVGKYLSANVVLWPRPLVLFASRKAFFALTPAERHILRQAAADDVIAQTAVVRDTERADISTLCRAGHLQFLDASSADLAALRRAVQPVYDQLERDPQTRRYIREIEPMREGIRSEPVPGCTRSPQLAVKAGSLDGVYQFTATLSDLRAAGADPSELLPENYGAWIIVVDQGRFALAQENTPAHACSWAYGKLALKGNRIEFWVSDGGGITPTGATDKPGELYTYTWSLYRDTVTLGRVPGAVSPTPTMAKPWRRITRTPSPRFFDKRCPPPGKALSR